MSELVVVVHAITQAMREARFPGDESIESAAVRTLPPPLESAFARADRVLTAPEARTRETAALFGVDPQVEDALREQDPGSWSGRDLGDFDMIELGAWLGDPDFAPPGGESARDLFKRVGDWLETVEDRRVVAVTHPAVARAVTVLALGLPIEGFWRIEARPLATLHLRRDPRRWILRL